MNTLQVPPDWSWKVSRSFQAIEETDPTPFCPQYWAFMSYPCLFHLSFVTWLLLCSPFPCPTALLAHSKIWHQDCLLSQHRSFSSCSILSWLTLGSLSFHLTALVPKHIPLPSVSLCSHPKLFLALMVSIPIWHQSLITISSRLLWLVSSLSLNWFTQFCLLPLKASSRSILLTWSYLQILPSLHSASLSLSVPFLLTKLAPLSPMLKTVFLSRESGWSLKAQKKQALGSSGPAAPGPGHIGADITGKIWLLSWGHMWEQGQSVELISAHFNRKIIEYQVWKDHRDHTV